MNLVDDGYTLKEACEKLEISLTSYRRWRNQIIANPDFVKQEAIEMASRRPKRFARQVSASTRQRVIEVAHQPHHQSANSIAEQLRAEGIRIGNAKVNEILVEEGLFGEIYIQQPSGAYKRKRGLLKLCEKRQKGRTEDEEG